MKIKLFTHGLDLDGNSCIIVMHFIHCSIDHKKDVNVSREDYHTIDDSLVKFIEAKEYMNYDKVFITDINITPETAKLIQKIIDTESPSCEFFYIDHHDKHINELSEYKWAYIHVVDDMGIKISATKILYKLFEYSIDQSVRNELSRYVELVSVYDTWIWEKENIQEAKDLHILMSLYGKKEFVTHMIKHISSVSPYTSIFKFSDLDKIILNMERKRIKDYINDKIKEVQVNTIFNQTVGVVFVEARQYGSELGQLICRQLNCDIALMIDISRREVSLRSVKDNFHLGKWVEKNFGGGGHEKAAGYQIHESKTCYITDLITLMTD